MFCSGRFSQIWENTVRWIRFAFREWRWPTRRWVTSLSLVRTSRSSTSAGGKRNRYERVTYQSIFLLLLFWWITLLTLSFVSEKLSAHSVLMISSRLPHLFSINLWGIPAISDLCMKVRNAKKKRKNEKEEGVNNLFSFSSSSLKWLCSKLHKLRTLNVSDCSITDDSVLSIISGIPGIRKLNLWSVADISPAAIQLLTKYRRIHTPESCLFLSLSSVYSTLLFFTLQYLSCFLLLLPLLLQICDWLGEFGVELLSAARRQCTRSTCNFVYTTRVRGKQLCFSPFFFFFSFLTRSCS